MKYTKLLCREALLFPSASRMLVVKTADHSLCNDASCKPVALSRVNLICLLLKLEELKALAYFQAHSSSFDAQAGLLFQIYAMGRALKKSSITYLSSKTC